MKCMLYEVLVSVYQNYKGLRDKHGEKFKDV